MAVQKNTNITKYLPLLLFLLPVLFIVFVYTQFVPKYPVPYTVYDSYDELKSHLAESIDADVLYPDLDSLGVQSDKYYQNFTDLSHEKTRGYSFGYTVELSEHLFTTVTVVSSMPDKELAEETFLPNYKYLDMDIQRDYSIVDRLLDNRKQIWMYYKYVFIYDGIRYTITTQNNITNISDQETVVQHLQKHMEDVIRSLGVEKTKRQR